MDFFPIGIWKIDWVTLLVLSLGYLVPYVVAHARGHNNRTPILILTLLLGWTLIGWVVALVWATTKDTDGRTPKVSKRLAAGCFVGTFLFLLTLGVVDYFLLVRQIENIGKRVDEIASSRSR